VASIDPFTTANKNSGTYWARVNVAFDELKLLDPNFSKVDMDHNQSGISHRRGIIQACFNK
jgi:hypothetical protein